MQKRKKTSPYTIKRDFLKGEIVFCYLKNRVIRIKKNHLPDECRVCMSWKCCHTRPATNDHAFFIWSPAGRTIESKLKVKQVIKNGTTGKRGRSARRTQNGCIPRNK